MIPCSVRTPRPFPRRAWQLCGWRCAALPAGPAGMALLHNWRLTRNAADIACSGTSSRGLLVVAPGGLLVVGGAGFEAAVQDADEAVGELAEGGLMTDAASAQCVVVGPGA